MGTPFGFPDWQNQRPLDGPLLLDLNAAVGLHSNIFGPVYVGRWARIAGDAFILTQPASWTFTWYADQAATKQLGQRILFTHNSIGVPLKFMLPNLGPWVTVLYTAGGAGNITITHHLYGTNRQQPTEVTPATPLLADRWPVTVNAGVTQTFWMADYHSGPVGVFFNPKAAGQLRLQPVVDNVGTTHAIYDVTLAANAVDMREVLLPPTAVQVLVSNTSGGLGDYYLTIVPSYTGA